MKILSLATILTSFLTLNAHADSIAYTQAPANAIGDTSAVWNYSADPGFTFTSDADMEAWAYFKVATSASFNRITWYGSNADGNFAVDLFAATCFSCSASWVSTDGTFATNLLPNTAAYGQADIHKSLISGNLGSYGSLYSYYIDLPSTLTLDSASPAYAISIVNNYTGAPFQWAASATGSGTHLHYIVGQAMFLRSPGNLAFTLSNVTPVPEADSYALLLVGIGVVGALARRKV